MMRVSTRLTVAALTFATVACSSGESGRTDTTGAATGATGAATGAATIPAADTGALLDPNAASREQIAALPGMTPQLADSVVAKRPIQNMLAVDSVLAKSLSEAQRDSIYARMFIPINLNTASDAEILLIPGIGNRMLREFKEYRPYDSMAKFRREIGKYVDKAEVARLEKYVRI